MLEMATSTGISNFYGKKQKRQWIAIEKTVNDIVKRHKIERVPKQFTPRINGPSLDWKTFFRQQDAFDFARSKASDLHVFAFESTTLESDTGQRRYLVCTYPVFWNYYRQMASTDKHHYEVIAEGAVCKLYFDIEFMRNENPDKDGSQMVDIFIKVVCFWLKQKFQVVCSRKNVLDLDASTNSKFSRHLVFLVPNVAFKDNIHIGNFVHFIAKELSKNISVGLDPGSERAECSATILESGEVTLADIKSLFVKNQHGEDVLFCDLGVYTKNRNFRLYQSCKLGKVNPLLLSAENNYIAEEEQVFLDSLIANVQYSDKLKVLSFDGDRVHGRKTNLADNTEDSKIHSAAPFEGYSQSPYPEVDQFISSCVQKNGSNSNGNIRHWTYFPQGETIVYEIAKYRWCENIGRAHKSNNIMLIVDLKRAVYYQKCHDPDCKTQNFKSDDHPLPKHVLPAAFFEDEVDDFEEEMNDDEFLEATLEMERKLDACSPNISTENVNSHSDNVSADSVT